MTITDNEQKMLIVKRLLDEKHITLDELITLLKEDPKPTQPIYRDDPFPKYITTDASQPKWTEQKGFGMDRTMTKTEDNGKINI